MFFLSFKFILNLSFLCNFSLIKFFNALNFKSNIINMKIFYLLFCRKNVMCHGKKFKIIVKSIYKQNFDKLNSCFTFDWGFFILFFSEFKINLTILRQSNVLLVFNFKHLEMYYKFKNILFEGSFCLLNVLNELTNLKDQCRKNEQSVYFVWNYTLITKLERVQSITLPSIVTGSRM